MVVLDNQGHSQFQLLQQYQQTGKGTLAYFVFDLLWLNNHDLRDLPLIQRKALLAKLLPKLHYTHISDYIEEQGEDFFKLAIDQGLEGIVAKDANSPYREGVRSKEWLKIKIKHRQEVVICGFTAPRGSRHHFGSLILGVYENNYLTYVGHTGSGFNEILLADLKKRLNRLIQAKSPFDNPPKPNAKVTWVKPVLVCEVSFAEWTKEGYLRQPIFVGIREDKNALEVHREELIMTEDFENKKNQQQITVNGKTLSLTNLDKIYWPKENYTKKELIEYYHAIADYILPHLKNRPESLHRHPEGIEKPGFFQKNIEKAPEWITIEKIHSRHEQKNINYLICQNEATLIYMANLGCIEINPWLSRMESLLNPDYCVFDLDPEDIGFDAVIEVAQALHQLLNKIGAPNYCKTSGATGLHILVPLSAQYTYQQSQDFAEIVVAVINQKLPNITSIIRSPRKRQKKVYLDFLQNKKGQTIAAPYCIRPREGAPVSTPLKWREVKYGLDPLRFNIKTIPKRLNKLGDIWQPVLSEGIDMHSCLEQLQKLIKK